MSLSSSSWCQGLAASCDCGTPWTFLFTFQSYLRRRCLSSSTMTEVNNPKFVFLKIIKSINTKAKLGMFRWTDLDST